MSKPSAIVRARIKVQAAGAVEDAVKRGTLRVGMDPTYMPFEMTNKRGQIIGFEVDLLKAMAKSMGVKLELVSTSYDGIIPALLTDKFDMIGSGMTLTQERNLRLNFSEPFIVVGQTLLVRKELEGKIKSYKDLNDPQYSITSKIGTTGEIVARKLISKAKPIAADFVGIDVPDRYVFGYGMDVRGAWRNLPAIYALK